MKAVNYIKSGPFYLRTFSALCDETGSSYTALLPHTEVRCLSRGVVSVRVFALRSEI
jgi:hypothetical protein